MKATVILWKDKDGKEHAYLIDKKNHIIPESFEFYLRSRKDVSEVKRLPIEPIIDQHSTVIIKSLEPLPDEVTSILKIMGTEHDRTLDRGNSCYGCGRGP